MIRCIQNYAMPKERDLDNTVLSLRLTSPEAARFWRIMDAAKARNAYVGKSDIARELLGINPPTALTKGEIEFFRTGKKEGVLVAPKSKTGGIIEPRAKPKKNKAA